MALTEAELSELMDELAEHWEEAILERNMHQPAARRNQGVCGGDASRITAAMGLTRHTYVTAKGVRLLLENGMMAQAIPLVRLAYECALPATHLVQSEGRHSILAFLHEHPASESRSRMTLMRRSLQRFGKAPTRSRTPTPPLRRVL